MNRILTWVIVVLTAPVPTAESTDLQISPQVLAAEQARIEVVRRITPATIAIFSQAADNGGSGVILSADGYALTNFHVVAPCGPFMQCGLPDGSMVKAVLVGLDPTGDIALIRLLEKRKYPFASLGDSAKAMVGDEVFVAGNPFLLADDFQPTVTHGVLSGVRRYQYPAGGILEYADCLQTDAAINPGNSGGPLYDRDGRLIGINGRASFEKRGRVNVGVGYAVSINQVKRFIEQLKSGRIVDHGALGATVRTTNDRRVLVNAIDESSDAYRRGLRYGDQVLAIDGRRITSANGVMNAVATRPANWRTQLTFRSGDRQRTEWVRLEPRRQGSELEQAVEGQLTPLNSDNKEKLANNPQPQYEHRPGYSNYAVSRRSTAARLASCPQRQAVVGEWRLVGEDDKQDQVVLQLGDQRSEALTPGGRFWLETTRPLHQQAGPPGSGGLLVALHAWRQFVVSEDQPASPFVLHGPTPWGPAGQRADRIDGAFDLARVEFYLDRSEHRLIGIEAWLRDDVDPCRLTFSAFGQGPPALGSDAPGRVTISRGDKQIAVWSLLDLQLEPPTDEDRP